MDNLFEVPDFAPSIKTVLWENLPSDKVLLKDIMHFKLYAFSLIQHVFVASDTEIVYTYTFYGNTINGRAIVCSMNVCY